ncbi:saccharopine dehydrogenase NADP-binding domain-containing protein [Candidatus Dependentiae bacterium]|nr:saccharopine dehydrogenase NADP-binding domain-containing protein [Candidatus Dependentiae bacterium]MBU4387140.1 saccharopine dehydrogenase NADP-binding domain-containing protein [Candidatus Dependentiae bacterium]
MIKNELKYPKVKVQIPKTKIKFDGKLLIIGCGAVAQSAIPLILRHFIMPTKNITIMDFVDNKHRIQDALKAGVNYIFEKITAKNYKKLLAKHVGSGDMIIDLAWNIECWDILNWCRNNTVLYINTSIEQWDPYSDKNRTDPRKYTLYTRHMKLRKLIAEKWGGKKGTTAIVDHGANPGLVSHFTKKALIDIANKVIEIKPKDKRIKDFKKYITEKNFPKLAQLLNVKVLHISERDSQITDKPKQVDEFVNTWSVEGFYEEGVAPAELGWGTHENKLPENAYTYNHGPKNQICLGTLGMNTLVRSWVPSGEINGMVIRHGEAFGLSDRLTVWKNGKAIYRPTVHYAYCPCDSAIASLHELRMKQYNVQKKQRILNDDIIDGRDELGVLLMGHDFNSWWIGSALDIHTARKLVPHQQATTLQVAVSVVGAALWMIKNPKEGFLLPDDIDHEFILNFATPYIEPFISIQSDWTPLKNINKKYLKFGSKAPDKKTLWQFESFLVDDRL